MSHRLYLLALAGALISTSIFSIRASSTPGTDNTVLNSLNVQSCWTAPTQVPLIKSDSQFSESALARVCIRTIGLVLTPQGLVTEIAGEYTHASGKTDFGFRTPTQNLAELQGTSQDADGVFITNLLNLAPRTCLVSHTVPETCTDASGDVSYSCPKVVCDKSLKQEAVLHYSVKGLTSTESRPKVAPTVYLKVTDEVSGKIELYKYDEAKPESRP